MAENVEKGITFQNTTTNHEIELGSDNIREFRTPETLILRGQFVLKEGGKVEFEPFAPGLAESTGYEGLIEETTRNHINNLFLALKPHEGKVVTLRFPDKDNWAYGTEKVVLEKCTTTHVNLRRPAELRTGEFPFKLPGIQETGYNIPEQAASVPLQSVTLAEDLDNKRPMLVFDHSFWKPDLPNPID